VLALFLQNIITCVLALFLQNIITCVLALFLQNIITRNFVWLSLLISLLCM
jgi:hypothetical protein